MAGTLVVDALKSGTTGPAVFQNTSGVEVGQLCRAWVNFNGVTTATIRASFNVSSVTRNGTGDYTVNFTNAMSDANYCAVMASAINSAGTGSSSVMHISGDVYSTTQVRFKHFTYTGTLNEDAYITNDAVFR